MKVRIQFAKYGVMKFIGHLDVMRFFQKAIRRADIDIRYSEGFSPHQIMSFAAPLGVGIESTGEYLDIEVNSMTSTDEIKDALNRVMVEGMEVISVKLLPDTVKNAMASVAAAGYIVVYNDLPIDEIERKLADFHMQERIPVTKTTKKSVMEIDIKPGIFELKAGKGINLPGKDINNQSAIYMLLDASSSGNIKPSMVIEELCKFCQTEFEKYNWQIIRTETYTKSEDGNLMPLSAVGK
ncbi:MAG: TIGR03936 family radical SAM-associated protein [Lachnospiraceae bacterium]|nr:TIGR03936 family radical SAM-associated protein [Lachnospiraceae bacterium]